MPLIVQSISVHICYFFLKYTTILQGGNNYLTSEEIEAQGD